jgi:hypothetical protein
VLRGGLDHAAQQLPVCRLDPLAIREGLPGASDAVGEGVSHALELVEAGEPGAGGRDGNPDFDLDPRKRLGRELGQLSLEAADLAAKLGAGEVLVAADSKRNRLSFEQIRHRSRV